MSSTEPTPTPSGGATTQAPRPATPFLNGLLSLAGDDLEVDLIPSAITFLNALNTSKTALQRAAALAQLEGNVVVDLAEAGPQLLGQVLPQINTVMQAQLAKAQAGIAAAAEAATTGTQATTS